ncbi:MAG: flippase [Candidatus Gracilibacteria bacterium]
MIDNKISKLFITFFQNLDLLKKSSVSFLLQIIGIGLSYLFLLLVSRFYGAEGMGIYALSFTVLNITVLFGKFGLDVSCVKFIGELYEKEEFDKMKDIYRKIMFIATPINIFLSVSLYFLSPFIAEYIFNKQNLTIYFQLVSLAILPMSFRFIHSNSIRGLQKITIYAFLQNVTMYFFALIILGCFLLLNGKEFIYPLIALLISMWIGFFISVYYWIRESKYFIVNQRDWKSIKDVLLISMPLLLSSSIMLVLGFSDTIMLGIFKNESDVGIYNVVYKIATAGMIIFMAMSSISAPKIAAAYGIKDFLKMKDIVLKSRKLIFLFTFPLTFIIIFFGSFILSLFGDKFVVGYFSLVILTLGFFIKSIFGISEYVLQMSAYQKILILYSLIIAFTNIILNYLLIPQYGINGAAVASMISIIIYQILLSQKVAKVFKISLFVGM